MGAMYYRDSNGDLVPMGQPGPRGLEGPEGPPGPASFVPVGTLLPFAGATVPGSEWLVCDGHSVSEEEYPELFAVIGTRYGTPTETGTFRLPDLRGRVVAGTDTMGGTGAGRLGWGEAWESALAAEPPNPNPGGDPAVISDGMILTAVQKWIPAS